VVYLNVHWGFLIDSLTCVMLLVVNVYIFISSYLFYFEYMAEDPFLIKIYGIFIFIIHFLC
jgi:NADH:ubiquinone oxidoreductase subunit 5 (subunit L)/multisubunit Na+/H+ antiporter MnhA subunit